MTIIRVGVVHKFQPLAIRLPNGKFAAYVEPRVSDAVPDAPHRMDPLHFDTEREALQAATRLARQFLGPQP